MVSRNQPRSLPSPRGRTVCQPGEKYSDIGGIIEDIVTAKGFTSVKEFCGHG